MAQCLSDKYLLVAAIDFGTTYSGYAFSTRNDFKTNPLKINANQEWIAGGRQLLSLKTPTCPLLDPDKKFMAFGYDAENRFAEIVENQGENYKQYYYFNRFKMKLHQNNDLSKDLEICDITGKNILALKVFSLSIEALKDSLMATLKNQYSDIKMDDIRWVLTVPTIWSDSAKQFMRRSAEMAGIEKDKLKIALEPEAASIYCQHLPLTLNTGSEKGLAVFEHGSKYMVVDMGGGTVDITVHEIIEGGNIREICRSTGGNCGGTSVDIAVLNMIQEITGQEVMDALRLNNMEEYLDLLREFETKKRKITFGKTGNVNMVLLVTTFQELCQDILGRDFKSAIKFSSLASTVSLHKDKLQMSAETFISLFQSSIENVIKLITETFDNQKTCGLKQILVVGGFSECILIQSALREAFPLNQIILPIDSGLAVLKGAVIFGHQPQRITERISKYTYGLGKRKLFDNAIHDVKYLKIIDGEEKCIRCFETIVKKDELLPLGKTISTKALSRSGNDGMFNLRIYKSEKEDPMYTDEEGCSVLGTVKMEKYNNTTPVHITVDLIFGDTEIHAIIAESKSRRCCLCTFEMI